MKSKIPQRTGILRDVANVNPQLLHDVNSFRANNTPPLADKIILQVKKLTVPLNGESETVLGALKRIFKSENYTAHLAALYEIEATKHGKVVNSEIAAQLYMEAANQSGELGIKASCYSRAFYCFISSKNSPAALDAAKKLLDSGAVQGLATFYYDAARLCEAIDKSLAAEFYFNATDGNYYHIMLAKKAFRALAPANRHYIVEKLPPLRVDARFPKRHD